MWTLNDPQGQRKYLTETERRAFLTAAEQEERQLRSFCALLAHTGCRISEALALTVARVDVIHHTVTFETLKKRRKGIFRTVPLPPEFADMLNLVHGIREIQAGKGNQNIRLWTWHRSTAWRKVKRVMERAGITTASAAMPKGLRHGYGVTAVLHDIPLNMAQKWLGHSSMQTTAIYADALGEEERQLAARMWRNNG